MAYPPEHGFVPLTSAKLARHLRDYLEGAVATSDGAAAAPGWGQRSSQSTGFFMASVDQRPLGASCLGLGFLSLLMGTHLLLMLAADRLGAVEEARVDEALSTTTPVTSRSSEWPSEPTPDAHFNPLPLPLGYLEDPRQP